VRLEPDARGDVGSTDGKAGTLLFPKPAASGITRAFSRERSTRKMFFLLATNLVAFRRHFAGRARRPYEQRGVSPRRSGAPGFRTRAADECKRAPYIGTGSRSEGLLLARRQIRDSDAATDASSSAKKRLEVEGEGSGPVTPRDPRRD
jgi:hypothetical protein